MHQHARSDALGIQVRIECLLRQRLEKACTDLPESASLAVGLRRSEAQAGCLHVCSGARVRILHQPQYSAVQPRTRFRSIGQRRSGNRHVRIMEAPLHGPQVRWMHPLAPRQRLRLAVLGKQRHRRHGLACEHMLQVFDQGKAGALDDGRCIIAAGLRPLNEPLDRSFHGAQHQGRRRHAHHLQRAAGLVELLACDAQGPRVQ